MVLTGKAVDLSTGQGTYLETRGRRGNQKISLECLLDLRDEGWSQSEIGRTCGLTRAAVHDRLKRVALLPFGEYWQRHARAEAEIYRAVLWGLNRTQIVQRLAHLNLGVTKTKVSLCRKWLPELKVPYRVWDDADLHRLYRAVLWGLTYQEILERLGWDGGLTTKGLIGVKSRLLPELSLPAGNKRGSRRPPRTRIYTHRETHKEV